MMPDTEQEIFDSAMDDKPIPVVDDAPQPEVVQQKTDERPRDDKGRFASKTEDKPAEVVEQPAPEPAQVVEDKPERGEIPAWRLREEAEAKREALARAEQYQRDAEEAKRQVAAFQQQLAQFQRQSQEKENPPPDMYADPEGYQRHQATQYQTALRQQAVQFNEQLARVKFGDELYDKAEQELARHVQTNPHDPIVHVVRNSSQPAFEVVKWFQQQEANKRLAGKSIDDLLKEHSEKLLEDPAYLARAIEKAKAKATPVQSATNTNIPSLNRATAAASDNNGADDNSDAALFKSALG